MWIPRSFFGKRRTSASIATHANVRRLPRAEQLEPRMLMAVAPIHVGVTYLETDYLETDSHGEGGNDSEPDRFIVSFTGGAPDTELTQLEINADKDNGGYSINDLIFDTSAGGRGKAGFAPFKVVKTESVSGGLITATADVQDGSSKLILHLTNFKAGDLLEFSIDVDQVLNLSSDLNAFNAGLDTISSGQEFQDTQLVATLNAPNYEQAIASTTFLNDYGDPAAQYGLRLPPDVGAGPNSRPNRTAGAVVSTTQVPKPISIAGTVWVDDNLNLRRDANESTLAGVQLSLWKKDESGQFVDTGLRQTTDANGKYLFGTLLGLKPGEYQVNETQPPGYFSVGAVVGQVRGQNIGRAASKDILSGIDIPLGDSQAINYDFAEARPAQISGFVYRDDNDNARKDTGEPGLPGVKVRLVPIDTIAPQSPIEAITGADGSYSFSSLPPGRYEVVEVTQPPNLTDGRDSAGTVDGRTVGVPDEPGDAIRAIDLTGGLRGVDYNFGELPLGSISGGVFLAPPGEDCSDENEADGTPLAGVVVELLGPSGITIARTTTGLDGQYRFDNVPKGIYSIIEFTPAGLLDGFSHSGRIDGIEVGVSQDGGTIRDVTLPAGKSGVRYDFCEAAPAKLSGYAYHDISNDGRRDANETPIAGVKIELINASGAVVATTQTAADGAYTFAGVLPGTYSIRETQPTGYLDGLDAAGMIAGVVVGTAANPGDLISGVAIRQGQTGVEYNFGELRPASIAGKVFVDNNNNNVQDSGELLLGGIKIHLLDSSGREVASTTTNNEGRYKFEEVPPGNYTIVEDQPAGYFEGAAIPGSVGGRVENPSRIGSITLTSGQVAVDYDFCERLPAEISGIVFVDRDGDCVRDPNEPPLAGVRVDLIDSSGDVVATKLTDSTGAYRFTDLPAGSYTLRETQPLGYFQGGQSVGSGGGDASQDDIISSIPIGFGDRLTQYNFCEIEPSSIAGQVFVDTNDDCIPDENETRIPDVVIQLYDGAGHLVATTKTNSSGRYQFDGLHPDQYRIVELQPDGYFSHDAMPGSGGGRADGPDAITDIVIGSGKTLVEYNFCELLPGSISGQVWQETDLNRRRDTGDLPVGGVTVELLDEFGNVITKSQTDANGGYRFDGLHPGVYAVRELQPTGLFTGGQNVGSVGGNGTVENLISSITLPAGVHAVDYDFPEFPPATISGNVFQDGGPITLSRPPQPNEIRQYRDGVYTVGDKAIGGVVLELRNVLGQPFTADRALPGVYSSGPIRVITNADGSYEFTGLRPGSYHVYQVQPQDFIDGLDTAGTTGGIAVNVGDFEKDPQTLAFIRTLAASPATDPADDAILNISLVAGGSSRSNNFSEIVIQNPPVPAPPIPAPPLPINPPPAPPLSPFDSFPKVVGTGQILSLRPPLLADAEYAVTWHLSVINGGFPRGTGPAGANTRVVAMQDFGINFAEGDHRSGRWTMIDRTGKRVELGYEITIGDEDATPLSGDFNGDGIDEVAIFVGGQWFVDLNGNGKWDAGDMWLRLGTKLDRPVVGDWDGDGKDDIGIFGPEWQRDPEAIVHDLGLPDPDNRRRRNAAQPVSNRKPILDKQRYLRRGEDGPLRADAIDHVFRYGEQPDTPLAGDWNGDGIDSIAVFRAGEWMLDQDADGRWSKDEKKVQFGEAGDTPLIGDWNGDGIDDLGVIRGDVWIIDSDGDRRLTGNDQQIKIARPSENSTPVVGDWDGDGKDELGWYDNAG